MKSSSDPTFSFPSERGAKLQGGTGICIAVQGADIEADADNVQSETCRELGFLFNAVVVIVAGQVVANTHPQLGVTEGVEFGAKGCPLGVVLKAKGFLFGQVHFRGDNVVFALVRDARCNHRVQL